MDKLEISIAVFGDSFSGKTSYIKRIIDGKFTETDKCDNNREGLTNYPTFTLKTSIGDIAVTFTEYNEKPLNNVSRDANMVFITATGKIGINHRDPKNAYCRAFSRPGIINGVFHLSNQTGDGIYEPLEALLSCWSKRMVYIDRPPVIIEEMSVDEDNAAPIVPGVTKVDTDVKSPNKPPKPADKPVIRDKIYEFTNGTISISLKNVKISEISLDDSGCTITF